MTDVDAMEGVVPAPSIVASAEELAEIVAEVKQNGAFCFDVETRGVLENFPDLQKVMADALENHLATLKRVNDDIRAQNEVRFEREFRKQLALDPNRNDVFWLGIATNGRSWAIPMGHPVGKMIKPPEIGDGSTVPPPGYRKLLKSGKESMAKARYHIPAEFGPAPEQLDRGTVIDALRDIFFDTTIIKVGHNVKFDARSMAKYFGCIPPGPYVDTMIYQHVLNENLMSYSLESLIAANYKDHDAYAREGKLGKVINDVAFDSAAAYVHLDVRWTWMLYQRLNRKIGDKPDLRETVNLDCDVLRVLMHMESEGFDVDVRAMAQLGKDLDKRAMELLVGVYQYAPPGFNPDSNVQKAELLFTGKRAGGLGLTPSRKTPGGKASVDSEALEALQGEHPVIDMLIEWSENKKLKTTYVEGLTAQLVKGKLHPSFNLHRTKTGRLSCVSGDTLLHTSRGTFTFEEYQPQMGDLVPTHLGNWKPVLRKIYKGTDFMFSVHLSNGSVLKCTLDHKVLTSEGWVPVRSLTVGSKVYSYGRKSIVRFGHAERGSRTLCVPFGGSSHSGRDGREGGNHLSERASYSSLQFGPREVQVRESPSVLTLKDGREKPYVGQEWFPTPQLPRGRGRRSRVLDEEGGRSVCVRSSAGDGGSSWDGNLARRMGGASHQRGQAGQQVGQPGLGDQLWAPGTTRQEVTVRKIAFVGEMGVWDIEVADDHSYVTSGFFNHNSSNPNLQNIPRESSVRGLFVAGRGNLLLVADYDQIELRVMAMFSQDQNLLNIFQSEQDIHAGAAALLYGKDIEDVTSEERQVGKGANFLTAYGGGADKLSRQTGLDIEVARKMIDRYHEQFSGLTKWKRKVVAQARRDGFVSTMSGRRRRLPELYFDDQYIRSKAERQAVNAVVQGSAADLCKQAMLDVYTAFEPTPTRLLVQVHDELVARAPLDRAYEDAELMSKAMGDGRVIDGVPLRVSCHSAYSWSEAKGK